MIQGKEKRERDSGGKARNRSWWGLSRDRHLPNRPTRYAEACGNPSGDALCWSCNRAIGRESAGKIWRLALEFD